jgi:hypothetical protein
MIYSMGQAIVDRGDCVSAAVEKAARELVGFERIGDSTFVNLPLLYPDGSCVTVRIDQIPDGFRVSDNGFAYREIEAVGYEGSFARTANIAAEREGVLAGKRSIYVDAAGDELFRAMCDVATASWRVAERVYERITEDSAFQIIDEFRQRLCKVFGPASVREDREISGFSSKKWEVSAIVDTPGSAIVFQIVTNHPNSIYKTVTLFHDLALLPKAPRLVSAVSTKAEFGNNITLLSQVGHVIELSAPDETLVRAAA